MASDQIIKPGSMTWQKEWDFNARNLSLDQGLPSKIGLTLQPRIGRLDIFGTVGKFPASGSGYVGFAQVSAAVSLPKSSNSFKLTLSSQTPQTRIKFILFSSDYDKGSYQVNIDAKVQAEEFIFRPEDFDFYVRGHLDASARPIDFEKVHRIGFLMTRSSQSSVDADIHFDFSVHKIEVLFN